MKSYISCLLSMIFCVSCSLLCSQGPAKQPLPRYMVNPEALNNPDFINQMQQAEEFLNNLTEEEMKEFMSFYEEFLKGVESGEIDLNDYLPEGILQPLTPEQAEELVKQEEPTHVPAPEQPTVPVSTTPAVAVEDVNDAIAMINGIISRINSVLNKAESDPTVSDSINPWKERLHKLVAYLTILNQKKHVQRLLADQEHKSVLDILKHLHQQLATFEPQITIPEFGLGVLQKQEKEVSKRALQKVMSALDEAITDKDVLQKIEKIFKQYEPEALKKAQEMIAAEERAKKPTPTSGPSFYTPTGTDRDGISKKFDQRGSYAGPYDLPDYYSNYGSSPSFWDQDTPSTPSSSFDTKPTAKATPGSSKKKEPATQDEKPASTKSDKESKPTASSNSKDVKEIKKTLSDIEDLTEDIVEELLPATDKARTNFIDEVIDQNKTTSSLEKLQKINEKLGRLNRRNGQFKSTIKKIKHDTYSAEKTKLLNNLRDKLKPLYSELKGVTLPSTLDTTHAQAIDTFIKNTELLFPNLTAVQPTAKRTLKPIVKSQPPLSTQTTSAAPAPSASIVPAPIVPTAPTSTPAPTPQPILSPIQPNIGINTATPHIAPTQTPPDLEIENLD